MWPRHSLQMLARFQIFKTYFDTVLLCCVKFSLRTTAAGYPIILYHTKQHGKMVQLSVFQAALCLPSLWCYVEIKYFLLTFFSLPFSELRLIGLDFDLVD